MAFQAQCPISHKGFASTVYMQVANGFNDFKQIIVPCKLQIIL